MEQRFLQTRFWAEFKSLHGWKALYFAVNRNDYSIKKLANERLLANKTTEHSEDRNFNDQTFVISVLVRSFSVAKIKKFSLAYIPMIPEMPATDNAEITEIQNELNTSICKISESIKQYLPENTLFIRFDPAIDFFSPEERDFFNKKTEKYLKEIKSKLVKAPVAIQPADTTILDLSKSEDELLSGMKNKWRYNIRLASKKDVQITKHFGSDEDFEENFLQFYNLFMQTSERDGVSFHNKEYYIDLLKKGSQSKKEEEPLITLYLAHHEKDYLAGIITLFSKKEAVYLYGASGNVKRNLMPAYLLQWTAIKDAKAYGSECYDFYGMPPTGNENHPMHGLYLFKTGFGGKNTHRPGSFDYPLKKDYAFYVLAEKLRAWWFKKAVKKIRRR